MPDEQSIFDVLAGEPEPTGFGGAVRSGLSAFSDMFQEAVPALLKADQDDIGLGELAAASFIGELGGPSRERRAATAARREESMDFLKEHFDDLDDESKQAIVSFFTPGLGVEKEMSSAEENLIENAAKTFGDPDATSEDIENARQVLRTDPGARKILDQVTFMFPDEESQLVETSTLNTMIREYTPESLGNFLNEAHPDYNQWGKLARIPQKDRPGGQPEAPDRQFARESWNKYDLLKKQNQGLSDSDVFNLPEDEGGLSDLEKSAMSNVAKQTAGAAPETYASIRTKNRNYLMQNNPWRVMPSMIVNDPAKLAEIEEQADILTISEIERLKARGVVVDVPGAPGFRHPAAFGQGTPAAAEPTAAPGAIPVVTPITGGEPVPVTEFIRTLPTAQRADVMNVAESILERDTSLNPDNRGDVRTAITRALKQMNIVQ